MKDVLNNRRISPLFFGFFVCILLAGSIVLSQSKETIMQTQQALNHSGFDAGPVDGILGDQTRRALRAFQAEKGFSVTGKPDRRTLESLGISDRGESKGLVQRVGGGAKSAGKAVGKGVGRAGTATAGAAMTGARAGVKGGQAAASGATAGAKATTRGATVAGKAVAKGAVVGARATAKGATVVAKGVGAAASSTKNFMVGGPEEPGDPALVQRVQEALKREGFDPGPIDGLLGPRTRTAILRFQREHRLRDNGRINRQTLEELGIE